MTTHELFEECARLKRETDELWSKLLHKYGTWATLGDSSDAQRAKSLLLDASDNLRFAGHALLSVECAEPKTLGHHPAPGVDHE